MLADQVRPNAPRRWWSGLSKYERILIILFLATIPVVYPSVRGDGVGYYAYLRSALIDRDLQFKDEMVAGGLMQPADSSWYTSTGHVANGWPVGASILWAPFIVAAHLLVLGLNTLGAHIPRDGYSWPYTETLAVSSALYGFMGLFLSFRLARVYFHERWAFWATIGIWVASSLPVYMYFNPAYAHADSAFMTALFLWYWHRTRPTPSLGQWSTLGVISGLMIEVYYPSAVFLLLALSDSFKRYWRAYREPARDWQHLAHFAMTDFAFAAALFAAFIPTFVTRYVLYGSPFKSGHVPLGTWHWGSPVLTDVLFSSNHGLFSWTPILLPATLGLFTLWRRAPRIAAHLVAVFLLFYYTVAAYPYWHGASSFGSRLFISLTPAFVLGLASALHTLGAFFTTRHAVATTAALVGLLGAWNFGLFIQWGTNRIPDQGPVSWREVAYNQIVTVPRRLSRTLRHYYEQRRLILHGDTRPDGARPDSANRADTAGVPRVLEN